MPTTKESEDYFAKEMKKISAKIQDQYNSSDVKYDPNLYQTVVHSSSRYAPQVHMRTLEQYITQIKVLQEFQTEKSTKAHIKWYTHRSPLGCFMCEDMQFISTLIQVLEYISKTYPNLPIRPN